MDISRPNIILVIIDGLRPKDLSIYGRKKELDSNIKKIASESILFKNNFSASNASDVSLTAIFSGQYPSTNGLMHQAPNTKNEEIEKLRKNKFWLPLYLQKAGYDTISVTPQYMWFKKGFDYYMKKEACGSGKYLNIPSVKRVLLTIPDWMYRLGKKFVKIRASPQFYSSEEVIDSSIAHIKNSKKPFFLFMHLVDTHCPYPGVKPKKVQAKNTIKNIVDSIDSSSQKEYIKKRFFDASTNSLEQMKQKLDDAISDVDKNIGRLYNFLKKEKLWDSTIFIISSDHGDNFGEHNIYFCRGGLYDTSIHVPLIMSIPGIHNNQVDELTQSIDIAPTILEIIGNENKNIDGKSLLNVIKKGKGREKIISFDSYADSAVAVRTKTKKYITRDDSHCYLCKALHGAAHEEYDLMHDPEEKNNIHDGKSK